MQTDVVHLMPFFSFFSRRKEGWWREKTERSGDLFFFCLFVSCSPSSLVLSRPPTYLFFSSPFLLLKNSPSSSLSFSPHKKEKNLSFAFFVRIALLLLLVLLCFLLAVVVVVIAST